MSVNTTPMVRFYADTAEAAKEVVRLAYVGGLVPLSSGATVVEGVGLGLPDGWVVRFESRLCDADVVEWVRPRAAVAGMLEAAKATKPEHKV